MYSRLGEECAWFVEASCLARREFLSDCNRAALFLTLDTMSTDLILSRTFRTSIGFFVLSLTKTRLRLLYSIVMIVKKKPTKTVTQKQFFILNSCFITLEYNYLYKITK